MKSPKPSKRPVWSVWKHKQSQAIITNIELLLRDQYKINNQTGKWESVPSSYTKDMFEELNPAEFRFETCLKFNRFIYSGHGVTAQFKDLIHDQTFIMHIGEFETLMKNGKISEGFVQGIWKFQKHGSSIGIFLVEETNS